MRFKDLGFGDIKALMDRTEKENEHFIKKWSAVKP
jgi:hypothetical protein